MVLVQIHFGLWLFLTTPLCSFRLEVLRVCLFQTLLHARTTGWRWRHCFSDQRSGIQEFAAEWCTWLTGHTTLALNNINNMIVVL